MKINKQTQTLISWAKKYLDCDGKITAVIEQDNIIIQNDCLESGNILMTVTKKGDFLIGYTFNSEKQKWMVQ